MDDRVLYPWKTTCKITFLISSVCIFA
jgi:hypothetical protein